MILRSSRSLRIRSLSLLCRSLALRRESLASSIESLALRCESLVLDARALAVRSSCAWLLALPAAAVAPEERVLAIVGVNVVPMTGADAQGAEPVLADRTVLVAGDRILAIEPAGELRVPPDSLRVEGRGFFLVPGLIDLHVHIADEVELELYLAGGVTTVRNLSGGPEHLSMRERIAAGELLGPRIYASGGGVRGVDTLEGAAAIAREQAAAGYQFLKIYDDITPDAYRVLVEEARAHGIRPCGHVPRNLRLADVLAAPPDSIDHAEEFLYSYFEPGLETSEIPEFVELVSKSKIAVVATLVTYDLIGRQVADLAGMFERADVRYASAYQLGAWGPGRNRYERFDPEDAPRLRHALAFQKEFLRALHAAGVPILLGTDSGGQGVPFLLPGTSAHAELVHLGDVMTPDEALAAATREGARFLGCLDETGTLEPGKAADFVLLAGNPLEDLDNVALVAGVCARGRWIGARERRARLDRIVEQSRREAEVLSVLAEGGPKAFAEWWEAWKGEGVPFREHSLNELGYERLYTKSDPAGAVELFRINAQAHPASWNAYDSLGEALLALGEREEARAAYAESVRLEPLNTAGRRALEELGGE